jgi:tetratricopeptide (TPR) repeat protein
MERARASAERAAALQPFLPEAFVARAWIAYASGQHDTAIQMARQAIERQRDCEGAYYLLGRALFAAGRYQEVADIADAAIAASGEDYNIYVPIMNSLGALGKAEACSNIRQRRAAALETHLRGVPDDARARIQLAIDYGGVGRADDAMRELNLAMILRPNEATVLYNAACAFCVLGRKAEALDALDKAREAGFRDPEWVRRDPDLAALHGDPDFERLYPPTA